MKGVVPTLLTCALAISSANTGAAPDARSYLTTLAGERAIACARAITAKGGDARNERTLLECMMALRSARAARAIAARVRAHLR